MKKLLTLFFLITLFYNSTNAQYLNYSINWYHNGKDSLIYSWTRYNPVPPDTIGIYPGDSVAINYFCYRCLQSEAMFYYRGILIDSSFGVSSPDEFIYFRRIIRDTGEYVLAVDSIAFYHKFHLVYYSKAGIENVSANDFEIYPNPATTQLTLQLSEVVKGNFAFQIYDVMGREVSSPTLLQERGVTEIDISSLQAGVYFLKINDEESSVVKRFLKE